MTDSLNFNSTNIRTAHGIFLDLVSGYFEPAEVRGIDVVVPGASGRTVQSRVKDKRTIMLTGYVEGSDAADWESKTTTLMTAMDRSAAPPTLTVANSYLGTTGSHTIAARCVNLVPGPIIAGRFQRWSIELESVAPDWS
jgi:hypothetical protein